ncbi:hypothetical protein Ais01nite_72310 [Asanoa ishikariensis]|uniref:DUF3558 domain-containing protein n=1 Tax=Asanoa ishikariensis TaxID=137265 RepID=A0A1H3UQI1_9ACTN|nr:hypothetical protein [Asanoa ishikariensis]GIF69196.1 hypothetical protein Ais01nite_72310 [Asanoa ishikariensis]SDZ64486.1 hypothetical protein SAMN05421684_7765 [Asanoa ishikariensis]
MRLIRFATLVVVAALVGCSDNPSSTAPAPSASAPASPVAGCGFHRFEDAAAVLNAPMNPTPKTDDVEPGAKDTRFLSCVWWTADDKNYANVGYREALTPAGAEDNKVQFANQQTADAVTINGLGDAAYWDTPNGQILVFVGENLLLVTTGVRDGKGTERSQADTTKLATLVVSHLGG